MSFGFSAGDFVASVSLITKVVKSLNESTGSVAEVKTLAGTLESLKNAIQTSGDFYAQFGKFYGNDGTSLVAMDMRSSIERERQQCDEILEAFMKTLKPYQDSFSENGSSKLVRHARQIGWLLRRDDAVGLNRSLTSHLAALDLYCKLLSHMRAESLLQTASTILSNVLDLKAHVTSITDIIQPCQSIPSSLGYPWEVRSAIADTVTLLDAIGRTILLPWMLMSSIEDLHQLLLIMYRDVPGQKKILGREYNLTDDTDEDLDGVMVDKSNWETTIRRGMQLSVNIIMPTSHLVDLQKCPQCKTVCFSHDLPQKRRRCRQCQLTFQIFDKERVIESSVSTDGPISLQAQVIERGLSSLNSPCRELSNGRNDAFRFRKIHYHREVPKIQQSIETASSNTITRQLLVEELPPLHKAAATGIVSEINRLLDEGCAADTPLPFDAILSSPQLPDWTPMKFGGCTPLHLACWFGKLSSIKVLLNRGANVLAQVPEYKFEALTFALLGHDPDSVFYPLVEQGARLEYKDTEGQYNFITACDIGNKSLIQHFLDHGTDLYAYGAEGVHALDSAAFGGHEQAFEVLLDAGAGIDPKWVISPEPNHQYSTLQYAAMGGSVKIIKIVLRHGQDPNQVDSEGYSPLHWALRYGRLEACETLLGYTENPYTIDKGGCSTLHTAAFASFHEIVDLLIQRGAGCNHESNIKQTSLHQACHWENRGSKMAQESTVTLLLQVGAHVNALDVNGDTPLHYAACGSNSKIAKILLDAGANALATSKYGITALHCACRAGCLPTARLLMEYGAEIEACDIWGATALHYSAKEGCAGVAVIAEMLLSGGASVHKTACDGATSLHYAAAKGYAALVQLFLDHGVNHEALSTLGRTALHSAARWGRTNCMEILLSHGADVLTAAPVGCKASIPEDEWQLEVEGCTPLICAVEHGHVAAVKFLLEHGAAVDVVRVDGKTALSCAVESGNIEIVQLLLNHGVDVEIRNLTGSTSLVQASRNNKDDIVKVILACGAAIDARDNEGRTALHWAAFGGSESTVRSLIENGALLTPDHLGRTPLHDAVYNGSEPLVKYLLDNGADPMARLAEGTTLACWTGYKSQKTASVEVKKEAQQDMGDFAGEVASSVRAEPTVTEQKVVRLALDIARIRGWMSIMEILVKD